MRPLALFLLLSSIAFGQSYERGLAKAESTNSPLVIVVTTQWCGPCKALKAEIETMRKAELRNAVVVYIDAEADPDLAKQLMDGTTVPQVIMYRRTNGIWRRVRAVGLQTRDRIAEMLRRVNVQ